MADGGEMKLVRSGDGDVEVLDEGSGEAVLLMQTALVADELLPLAHRLRRLGGCRTITYRRRGCAGSDPAPTPSSIERDACAPGGDRGGAAPLPAPSSAVGQDR
jgi:hypothetical protein